MRKNLVITLTGQDRVGIVERLTKMVLDYHGNVEASRMARLGGEFATLMLVDVAEANLDALREHVRSLRDEGFKLTTSVTERGYSAAHYADWKPYSVKLTGADHEGIVYNVAHYLAEKSINIEAMDTDTVKAPMSGIPLFAMEATVLAPPSLADDEWQEGLVALGVNLNVDIEISSQTGA
ncbi:MAG: hypothetical protein J5I90_04635 [Caldilineales bacterium]|nr:hypothetical protein [Caldilineales bacterium]